MYRDRSQISKPTLLVVDGDGQSRRVLEVSLRKEGFLVTAASGGNEALEKMEIVQPDVVVSDIYLSEMDGLTFCEQLRGDPRWKETPFFLLSKKQTMDEKVRGLQVGISESLNKPIFVKEIVSRINLLLQKQAREKLVQQKGLGIFDGDLGDTTVVDLIQTMELGEKSGQIHLNKSAKQSGTISFQNGKIVDSQVGQLKGEAAFYRMLTWNEGDFSLELRPLELNPSITQSNQDILSEGMRRVDEWGWLLEQLPPLNTIFQLDFKVLADRIGEIPDEVNSLLRLFDGHRTLLEVVEDGVFGDLEALSIIAKLYFEGLITESNNETVHESIENVDLKKGLVPVISLQPSESLMMTFSDDKTSVTLARPLVGSISAGNRTSTQQEIDEVSKKISFDKAVETTEAEVVEPLETDSESQVEKEWNVSDIQQEWEQAAAQKTPTQLTPLLSGAEKAPLSESETASIETDDIKTQAIDTEQQDLVTQQEQSFSSLESAQKIPTVETPITKDTDATREKAKVPTAETLQRLAAEQEKTEGKSLASESMLGVTSLEEDDPFGEAFGAAADSGTQIPVDETKIMQEETESQTTTSSYSQDGAESSSSALLVEDGLATCEKEEIPEEIHTEIVEEKITEKTQEVGDSQTNEVIEQKTEGITAEEVKHEEAAQVAQEAVVKKDSEGDDLSQIQKTSQTETSSSEAEVDSWLAVNEDKLNDDKAVSTDSSTNPAIAGEISTIDKKAEGAAKLAGTTNPNEASINVHDEVFFASDYESEEEFSEEDAGQQRRVKAKRNGVLATVGTLVIVGGIASYFCYKSPYFGDGPAELDVQEYLNKQKMGATDEEPALSNKVFKIGKEKAEPKKSESTTAKQPSSFEAKTADGVSPDEPLPKEGMSGSKGEYDSLIIKAKEEWANNQIKKAYNLFSKALKIQPQGWEAIQYMAVKAMEAGQMAIALKLAQKAKAMNENSPYAYLVIGSVLAEKPGKKTEAKAALMRFLDLCKDCRFTKDISNYVKSL